MGLPQVGRSGATPILGAGAVSCIAESVSEAATCPRSDAGTRGSARASPPPVYRLTKQALRAEALERIEGVGELEDRAALEVWSAAETHAHIREYLRRTVGK